jgi:ceramide glucosyltransferase
MTVIELLEIVLGLLIIAGSAYWLIAIYAVNRFFKPATINSASPVTPVSILKPLKGIDPELTENIKSFCDQKYPAYEVILGLNRPDDEETHAACRVVKSVPFTNLKMVSSNIELGVNQKVSNLQGILDEAHNGLVVLSDSDMRVDRDYLNTIVSEYQGSEDIGMVTCLYKISNPTSAGAAFESMSITLDFLPSVLVAERFEGVSFGLGASMIFSKKTLDEIGGFKAVADYIADDYQIGNRISKKGLKIVISKYIVENVTGHMSFAEYFRHQLRWARTVRVSRPGGYFGSGISHVIPFATFLCILRGADIVSMSALGLAVLLRLILAALVYRKVIRSREWLKWLVILPVKDIGSFLIWIGAFVGSNVSWRGSAYKIINDGRIRKTNSK